MILQSVARLKLCLRDTGRLAVASDGPTNHLDRASWEAGRDGAHAMSDANQRTEQSAQNAQTSSSSVSRYRVRQPPPSPAYQRWLDANLGIQPHETAPVVQEPTGGEGDQIDIARRVAKVVGSYSGAAQAVAEYDRRATLGEDPVCICHARTWLVMPRATFERAGR